MGGREGGKGRGGLVMGMEGGWWGVGGLRDELGVWGVLGGRPPEDKSPDVALPGSGFAHQMSRAAFDLGLTCVHTMGKSQR